VLVLVAGLVAGLLAAPAIPAAAGGRGSDDRARLVFRIDDERVVESSGLAVSRTRPGLAYTVNDSGDDARVFVLSMRDGAVVGETTLAGTEAEDFEAVAPAPGGRLVVGDIGDNDAERDSVEVYVIDEPRRGTRTVRPRTVALTYPGGPRDAEALVVRRPTLFVVSKEVFGGVYAARVLGSSRDRYRLRRVADAPSIVTDAALLADGDVVLRDYGRAHVVELPRWRVRETFRLPRVEQGETLASAPAGRRVYVGSEGGSSPVYVVDVPSAVPEDARAGSPSTPEPQQPEAQDRPRARPTGYLVAVAAALLIGLVLRGYRRRRRGRPPIQIR
jgi:hypothetical protein